MQDVPFKEYFYQVWKQRRLVGIIVLVILAVVAFTTFRQPKIYRAGTSIEIGAETPDVAFFQDVVNTSGYGWWAALKYYETQYQIIRSRNMLSKVAKRALDSGRLTGMTQDEATLFLQASISIGSDEKSRLAQIYFDDVDPKRAADISNLIAEVYVSENIAQKLQGVTSAVTWLTQRLQELQSEKRKQEEELMKKKAEFKVVNLKDRENAATANLIALTESLNRLKGQRIELEAQYRRLDELVKGSENVDDLLGVVSNELLTKLKQDLADHRAEKGKLSQQYMEKHPAILRINGQISEVEKFIRQEIINEVGRIRTKYFLAKAQEEAIAKAVESQKMEALKIEDISRQLEDIQVVTQTNQALFETLQKKLKEADLSQLVHSNNIRIVDAALIPDSPIRPDVKKNMIFGLLVGLLGGVAVALLLEYLDDTLKTHEDVDQYLQLPVLGVIPHFASAQDAEGGKPMGHIEFLPFDEPTAPISEFFRTLRTNILFQSATRSLKKLLIVSTGPGEGKTSLAINLAVTLAQTGQKTVVIDLDLRRPKLHQSFQVPLRGGVTNLIINEVTLDEAIQHSHIPNLDFIVAGTIPSNPAELLGSDQLNELLNALAARYDRVIIDSSPIAPVTDAVIASQIVDGVVLVVRAGKTHRKAVRFALEQLRNVKAAVLGAVLNDVDIQRSTYGNYQYYKYGYAVYGADAAKKEPTLPVGTA